MSPKQIKVENGKLIITWRNDQQSIISVPYLRDECPCAGCKGETILLHTYRPAESTIQSPEAYRIAAINPVGDYAIQITWKDGHDTGIYSWEYIMTLSSDDSQGKKQDYQPLI